MATQNAITAASQAQLEKMATVLGLSVVEYVKSLGYATVADVTKDVTKLQGEIDAITKLEGKDASSLTAQITAIDKVLSDKNGVVQSIYQDILLNKKDIADEVIRAEAAESTLSTNLAAEIVRAKASEKANADEIATINTTLASITGGTSGVTLKTIKTQQDTNTADITKNKADIATNVTAIKANADAIVKAEASAKAYTDAAVLNATDLNNCKINNKFRAALGLAAIDCTKSTSTSSGSGAVL